MKVKLTRLLPVILLATFVSFACDELLQEDTTPTAPELVYPPINAVVATGSLVLDWQCDDEDGDQLTCTLYFGLSDPPGEFASGITDSRYTVVNLEEESTYYWQIRVEDEDNKVVDSEVWSFMTEGPDNHAPDEPHSPGPADNETDVSIETTFSWECEDSDGDALTYTIEIDEERDGFIDFTANDLSSPLYVLEYPLLYGTEYAWTVTASDPSGATSTASWMFTTEAYGAGQMASAVFNNAVYGDPDYSSSLHPSGEWPVGSGDYYLFEGFLWIGAPAGATPDTLVSGSYYNGNDWLPSPLTEGEQRPTIAPEILGQGVWEFTCTFDDFGPFENYTPLELQVEQTVTAFPENGALGSLFLVELTITNHNEHTLSDLYVTVVLDGDVAAGPNAPSHANHGALDDLTGYDPEYQIGYVYDGDDPNYPGDDTGENGDTPGYLGVSFIGQDAVACQWWTWEDGIETDVDKYLLMTGQSPFSDGAFRSPPDTPLDYRVSLSVGPFRIYSDTTSEDKLDIAFVFGVGNGLPGLRAAVVAVREWYDENR